MKDEISSKNISIRLNVNIKEFILETKILELFVKIDFLQILNWLLIPTTLFEN